MNMTKALKLLLFTSLVLLLFLFIGKKLLENHVETIRTFAENVPMNSFYDDVRKKAEEIPFAKVELMEAYYWEEEERWMGPWIEVESTIDRDAISCSIIYSQEMTTGEHACSSYHVLLGPLSYE